MHGGEFGAGEQCACEFGVAQVGFGEIGVGEIGVRRRHLKHYLVVAKSVTRDIDQPGNDKRLDELRPELANFRVALDWAVTEPEATDAGLQLVARLSDVWTTDAHHAEGLS